MQPNILIVGAGVAGLFLKHQLEAQGLRPVLAEQSPTVRADGAGIILGPNVMRLFRSSGHEKAILERAQILDALDGVDAEGHTLSVTDLALVRQKSTFAAVAVHRKALHEVLYESVDHETLWLDEKVVTVTHQGSGFLVTFASGKTHACDYLIAADGIHSQVRKSLFGDEGLRDSGQVCWRFVCPRPASIDPVRACEMWGDGKRLGIVPLGEDKLYCYLVATKEGNQADMKLDAVLESFSTFGGAWPAIASGLDRSTPLLFGALADIARIRLRSGNAVLIGDAGHATTPNMGQGAAIGLESAYVFAKAVKEKGWDHALSHYERVRYKRVDFIREQSWKIGQIGHIRSRWGQKVRNAIMRCIPQKLAQKGFEKAFWGYYKE